MAFSYPTRAACEELDAEDPLAPLREQFVLPEGTLIYLDGNSLGAQPKAALERTRKIVEREWGNDLIRSWNSAGWFDLPRRLGNKLAPLIGAQPDEVVVADTTSINLFKGLVAALRMQTDPSRTVIVSERSNFPTDLYIAQGVKTLFDQSGRTLSLRLVDDADALPAAVGDDTAVVLLTHVNYRSGAMHDMQAVTAQAHAHGALTIWDLAHSVGAVPLDLHAAQADFAIGCTYKYLNGGPGAPAFLWVPKRHQANFRQPLTGWWGHTDPFAMSPDYQPASGIAQALCGTQPIVSLALVECGLDIFARTDMQALRRKSLALTDLFIELVETRCADLGLELLSPREHTRRGSQVGLIHAHAYAVMQALIAAGVIGDYREPGILRFGFAPLYVRYVDVWDAVEALRAILASRSWDAPQFTRRSTVT